MNLTAGIAFLLLTAIGFGDKTLTEEQQYNAIRTSIKYKAYKAVSEKSLPFIVSSYNKKMGDSLQIKDAYLHVMLGYYWSVGDKPAFAFAESDILKEKPDSTDRFAYMASMLNSCTMYQKGWKTLAKEESDKAILLFATEEEKENAEADVMVFHLLAGTVAAQQQDFEAAKFHFAGFSQLSGIDYPYKLADLLYDMKSGNVKSGMQKAKALGDDPSVPEAVRTRLKSVVKAAKKKGGDIDSPLFTTKLFSSVILDEMKESPRPVVQKLMQLLENVTGKLD